MSKIYLCIKCGKTTERYQSEKFCWPCMREQEKRIKLTVYG
jgi:NMD protein affecting ribosome stability and mRNA decay